MLTDEHVEHNAVNLVVYAIEGEHTHRAARLAIAVHAALALLVARGVPRQVIVHHRVEVLLQVDALAEAVGADQHALFGLCQLGDARFAFVRGQGAGHGSDFDVAQLLTQLLGDILGSWDEATEDNRIEAVADEGVNQADGLLQLFVPGAEQFLCLARHVEQAPPCPLATVSAQGAALSLRRWHRRGHYPA